MLQQEQADWRGWYQQNAKKLLLFARQQTRSEADAEDVLQEAFVRMWRVHGSKNGNPSVQPFFAAIRHAAIDLARSVDRRKAREEKSTGDASPDWFRCPFEQEEREQTLEKAVRQLPPEQQEVLILKVWGEQTFAEIGRTVSVSPNTAASRYRYALEALKNLLDGEAVR